MRQPLLLTAVLAACLPAVTLAADPAPGRQIFELRCAECHAPGPGHPGTQQLGWTRGAARAVLESRTDLQPAYVSAVVRNGLAEMPAFRPTEISDSELAKLAEYLAKARSRK